MAAGARYTVVASSLNIYTDAADAKAYRNPKSTITNTSSSIDGAGKMYIDNFAGWESYAPAVPIWFIPSWGGSGWSLGWVNDNENVYPSRKVSFYKRQSMTSADLILTRTVEHGGSAAVPANPSLSGFVFLKKWTDLAGTVVPAGGRVTNVTKDMKFTAMWSEAVTVTFNANGGSGGTTWSGFPSGQRLNWDGASLPSSPSRTGYIFNGWYTASSGGSRISSTQYIGASDTTFYAQWTIRTYIVTFKNYNGSTLKTQIVDYGSNASPPTSPSITGYTFAGWSGTYTNVTSDRTITATFKIKTYTVTFKNYNGAVLKTQTVNYRADATPPASPSRTGYIFTGWSGTYTTVTSNRTITAVFASRTYTVTFKDWDNTTLKTQSVNYGSSASPPTTPKRVGYNFIGWDRVYTNITSSRTITAIYEKAVPNFVMKVDGVNRNAAQMWVKVDGQLRIAEQAQTLVSGQIKEI